eukprot:jgi/Tetstr1/430947/TSEL_020703.t1
MVRGVTAHGPRAAGGPVNLPRCIGEGLPKTGSGCRRYQSPLTESNGWRPCPRLSIIAAASDHQEKLVNNAWQYPHGCTTISPESLSMAVTVAAIQGYREEPMSEPSKYVVPYSARFRLKGRERRWDIIKSMPSVGVVLYHTEWDAFLLVRQFRPAVYSAQCATAEESSNATLALEAGFTYEVCAGLIDKDKSILQICHEEIIEECGYNVRTDSIRPVTTYIGSAGNSGATHNLFAAKVDESMREGDGGGLHSDGEAIEVLRLPRANSEAFLEDLSIPKSAGLVTGLTWAIWKLDSGKW